MKKKLSLDERYADVLIFRDDDDGNYRLFYSTIADPENTLSYLLDSCGDDAATEEAAVFLNCDVDELPMVAHG